MPTAPIRPWRATLASVAMMTLAIVPVSARAQVLPANGPVDEYERVLGLLGTSPPPLVEIRAGTLWHPTVPDTVEHPWRSSMGDAGRTESASRPTVTTHPVRLRSFFNSAYPWGDGDGVVWQGRGLTSALDGGATVVWGPLTVTVHPTVAFNQNESFPLPSFSRPGASEYGYPWRGIDLPQRFGPDAFWTLDPGESAARITWRAVDAGFGTESLWWGPGIENGILMSDNAPGFPHAFLATAHPVDIGIGEVSAQWVWGRLQESDWSDDSSEWYAETSLTSRRFFTGAVGAFRPRGMAWMTLGASRVFVQAIPESGLGAGEYFLIFQRARKESFVTPSNPTGQDTRDQMLALFARWAPPASGFEAYVEWARNDHAYDSRALMLEPEHSQGYTLGVRQVVELPGNRILSLHGELTHLEQPSTRLAFYYSSYYAHWAVPQGYTQRGQILGAAVGPAGNGQLVSADLYHPGGRVGVFGQRRVRDNDAYWERAPAQSWGDCCHDVEITGGIRTHWFVGAFDVGAGAAATRNLNRHFRREHDVTNLNVALSVTWQPSRTSP